MRNDSTSLARRTLRASAAGLLATLPMTLVILAARRLRLLRTPPPQEITERAAARVTAPGVRAQLISHSAWLLAHGGYGALSGVIYDRVRPRLPRAPYRAGLVFGGLVWGVSYLGLMPALRLYPWPDEDAPPRLAVMVAAHAVYGVALATAVEELDH